MLALFLSREFLRFLLVSGVAACVNALARLILNQWFSFSLSVAYAYGFGMLTAFLCNRFFVFPSTDRPIYRQIRDFVLFNFLCFPIIWFSAIALQRGLLRLGYTAYTETIAHIVALAIPGFLAFLFHKFFTFQAKK